MPILAETSSCNNRGAEGMSDRFLASFLWLDKLGLTAKLGVDLLVRQTVWGYNYPLLNSEYGPNSVSWTFYGPVPSTPVKWIIHYLYQIDIAAPSSVLATAGISSMLNIFLKRAFKGLVGRHPAQESGRKYRDFSYSRWRRFKTGKAVCPLRQIRLSMGR